MIMFLLTEVEKTKKHEIMESVNDILMVFSVDPKQVINIQVKDATTTLYQIWIWYNDR